MTTDRIIIVASPDSIGNLGQLAVDLLMENSDEYELEKLVKTRSLHPLIGHRTNNSINGPMEFYRGNGVDLVQIRSFPIDHVDFSREVAEFIQCQTDNYSAVIVLCGLSAVFSPSNNVIFDSSVKPSSSITDDSLVGSGSLVKHLKNDIRIIGKFCSEGDNISDAVDLYKYVISTIPSLTSIAKDTSATVRLPEEWKYGFGVNSTQQLNSIY